MYVAAHKSVFFYKQNEKHMTKFETEVAEVEKRKKGHMLQPLTKMKLQYTSCEYMHYKKVFSI